MSEYKRLEVICRVCKSYLDSEIKAGLTRVNIEVEPHRCDIQDSFECIRCVATLSVIHMSTINDVCIDCCPGTDETFTNGNMGDVY